MIADDDPLAEVNALTQLTRAADDAAARRHARTDEAVLVHDGALDGGVVSDPHVRPEDRIGADLRAGSDAAVVSYQHRRVDRRRRIDRRPFTDPDRIAYRKPPNVDLDTSLEHVGVGLQIRVERSDVLPIPVRREPEQRPSFFEQDREHFGGKVCRATRWDDIEHAWIKDVDPGVDAIREHLSPRWLLEEPLDSTVVARDHDPEFERVLHRLQRERRRRFVLVVEADQLSEVDVGQNVPGNDEKPVVEGIVRSAPSLRCRAEIPPSRSRSRPRIQSRHRSRSGSCSPKKRR